MKTKSITRISLMAIAVTAITLTACQKEKVSPQAPVVSNLSAAAGKKQAASLKLAIAAVAELQNALFTGSNSKLQAGNTTKDLVNTSSCATITYDTISKPNVKTIDYGTGCVGTDGNTRTGKIVITSNSTDFQTNLYTATLTFNNFTFNGNPMTGSETVLNNGNNINSHMTFSFNDNIQVASGTGPSDSVQGSYTYEWLAGQSSSPLANLQFSITGGYAINFSNSTTATVTVTSPLLRNYATASCNYYVQGTYTIQTINQPTETIDYGNGTCTGLETVTIGSNSTVQPQ